MLLPWEESMTITSTPASARSCSLCLSSGLVEMAAPTISWFLESLEARGQSRFFLRSVLDRRATSFWSSVGRGRFF